MQAFADRPWYLPFIAFLGGLDLFILIIPTDGLLLSYVLLCPKKWIRAFIIVSFGCAAGALVLALLMRSEWGWIMQSTVTQSMGKENWEWVEGFVAQHGEAALAFLAIMPIPQFPGVVIASWTQMPTTNIFFSIFAGRLLKYVVYAYGASHAPKLLLKIPSVKKELGSLTGPASIGENPKK